MTKVYKVRHKATGLYYSPGQYSNLSKEGKIYNKKNTVMSMLVGGYTTTVRVNNKVKKEYEDILRTLPQDHYGNIYVKLEDFELVEFEAEYKEVGIVK